MSKEPLNKNIEIGLKLQTTRQEKDIALADIAKRLKIRQKYLEHIEQGQFDLIPKGAYLLGYIKSYSAYLGVAIDISKLNITHNNGPESIALPRYEDSDNRVWWFVGGTLILCLTLLYYWSNSLTHKEKTLSYSDYKSSNYLNKTPES